MTYKRYLLSVLLLSMTGNVICDSPEKEQQSEEEKKLLEVENKRRQLKIALKLINNGIEKVELFQKHGNEYRGSFMLMSIDPVLNPELVKKATIELEEKVEKLIEEIKSDSKIKKLCQLLMSESKAKIPLDERSCESMARTLLLYNIYVAEMINSQSFKCLNDPKNSVDNCKILAMLTLSSFKEFNELNNQLELFKLEQRKRMLEKELDKLHQKEESIQSN